VLGRFAEAEAALRRSLALARTEGNLYRLTWSQSMLAFSLALEGRLDEADELLRDARTGNPAYPDTVTLEIAVWCNWMAGRFRPASDAWRESLSWTGGSTSSRRGWGIPPAAVSMAESGDVDAARACLDRTTETRPWLISAALYTWASGCLSTGDRSQDRVPRLAQAADELRGQGCLPFAAFACADLAEAALETDDTGAAQQAAATLEGMVPDLDRAPHRGLAELARACAMLAAGDGQGAADSARHAAGRFSGTGASALHGRALHVLGRALATINPNEAREALVGAIDVFTSCEADRRRERALQALSGLGQAGARAAAARRDTRDLTPRERDVVRLAVEGRTAREIGARLHIGERTVETHLANAYVKLGVASRLDLVRRAPDLRV